MNGELMIEDQTESYGEVKMMDTMSKEYRPKRQEILREYELRIKFLSVGCVVSVGCKEVPFRSVKEAMEEVNKFIENPYDETKRWIKLFEGEE